MISFEKFKTDGNVPIYLQILWYLKREAVSESIRDGDELPSRRVLSALLGVNPNTVQRAYRLLEEEGLIQSRAGAKSVMVLDDATVERLRVELLGNDVGWLVSRMRQMGVSREDAHGLLDRYWESETEVLR